MTISPQYHMRTSSTTSNATIPDITTQTEPLLPALELEITRSSPWQPVQPGSYESHQARASTERMPYRGQSSLWEIIVRKRLRLLKTMKYSLEALIAIWAVFNFIRYLYSYAKYTSSEGQTASLVLAICAGLSPAFLAWATLLSKFRVSLARKVPPRASHIIRKVLRFASTSLLFVPAVLNVIFLCIWRHSANRELTFKYRCYVDIDVVWSASGGHCAAPAWGIWLILALLRLVITVVVLVSYHIFSLAYGRTLRLSNSRGLQSLSLYETTDVSSVPSAGVLTKEDLHERHSTAQYRPSHSTLGSNVESIQQTIIPYHSFPRDRLPRSRSSSDDDHSANTIRLPPGLKLGEGQNSDSWSNALSEQFQTLISQINQEMDMVVSIARLSEDEDNDDSHSSPAPHSESPYSFNLPPLPPTVGYNEFGQPYPPEEPLPILNGFIRRMPTIESMGSREMGSIGSSMHTNKEPKMPGSARSTLTFDRPPTRPLSRTDFTSSGTSSRPNSFGARAELFASLGAPAATEMGELPDSGGRREEEAKRTPSPMSHLEVVQNPSASRSTMSYYTATSGSMGSAVGGVS
ncbi:hypothetical protein AX15_006064 [Amanita polypyramis BW_CC]|nr:hypothetical protein AX15_006064 [Amanita polypyramis BW_CC]